MEAIYKRMTKEQKKAAESHPELPPPTPLPPLRPLKNRKVDSPRVLHIAHKESIKNSFKTSQPNGLSFTPGESIYPKGDSFLTMETFDYKHNTIFYENDREITASEAGKKLASQEYFMDIEDLGKGNKKYVLTKKPWLVNQQDNTTQQNWQVKGEEMPVLEKGINPSIHKIQEHVKKGGKLIYNGNTISEEEAILLAQEQYIAFMTNGNKPENLILLANPMTEGADFYLDDKKLSEKEALQYRYNTNYKAISSTLSKK